MGEEMLLLDVGLFLCRRLDVCIVVAEVESTTALEIIEERFLFFESSSLNNV